MSEGCVGQVRGNDDGFFARSWCWEVCWVEECGVGFEAVEAGDLIGVVCRGCDEVSLWVEGSSGGRPRRLVLLSLSAFGRAETAASFFISVPISLGEVHGTDYAAGGISKE